MFLPSFGGQTLYDTIIFSVNTSYGSMGSYYYFDLGSFGAVGSYDTVLFGDWQAAHLNVSDTEAPAVPEPSTFLLLGAGLLGLGVIRRRASRA